MPAGAAKAAKDRALDLSSFPPYAVRRYTRFLCLACIFKIYTKQLHLAPRTAYNEVKRHAPTVEELTAPEASRPYFDSEDSNRHCPYCNSVKRWHAQLDTYRIEGGKPTDAARRQFIKSLPKSGGQFQALEKKSTSREVFFEWLDLLGRTFDFDNEAWLREAARCYLERKDPKTDWADVFAQIYAVRPSTRLETGWECDTGRLFLSPPLYSEVLLVQYLVSRSHKAGGRTFQGRVTLLELLRRFRHAGFLSAHGITESDQFEALEKLVDDLTGGDAAVKLYFIVDRRDFLERLKAVYSHYAA